MDEGRSAEADDRILAFTVPDRNVRGRVARIGPVLDTILSAHNYPKAIGELLAEALVLTALMGSLLKDNEGQMTLQAQTGEGAVDLLVCDYRAGELRGYVRHDPDRLAALGAHPSLFALFGHGYLAITFDLATTGQRYQGVVPLEGASLADACERYFAQSEQIPTLIRIGVKRGPSGYCAGGLLLQHLAEGEEGRERLHVRMDHPDWEHVAILACSVTDNELVDTGLARHDVVWRLFHDEGEIRAEDGPRMRRGCRCSIEHYRGVLSRFAPADLADMRNEEGQILVDCAFCSKEFEMDL